ncbi:MAG: hypothetical protein RL071_1288 [Pseudomonadota bacterium]|jgi:sulfite reductase (NADPH) flavoprotein alpha-component
MTEAAPSSSKNILILWGTETYTAEGLAQQASKALAKRGYAVKVDDIEKVTPESLRAARTVLIVTSTYGNGDPPANAEPLHAALMDEGAPTMEGLRFSVCGLGDTTYPRFAQCGKDFDRRLGELGALRLAPRQDCDVDVDEPFASWLSAVVAGLAALPWDEVVAAPAAAPAPAVAAAPVVVSAPVAFAGPPPRPDAPLGSRRNPATFTVLENHAATGPGASREVRHLRLDRGAGALNGTFDYAAGDSLALWAPNDPSVVDAILAAGRLHDDAPVRVGDDTLPLREALLHRLELTTFDARLADWIVDQGGKLAEPTEQVDVQLVDLVRGARVQFDPEVLVKALRPLAPRLYSIASGPSVSPGHVDLLASVVRYTAFGQPRWGVATGWMANRLPVGAQLHGYLQAAPHFRLPADEVDILMIGPGTGIAPFRAFLHERAARRAKGGSWLVYGSRNRAHDLLYAAELEGWRADGTLSRLDLAFSRDAGVSPDDRYVQHKLLAAGAEVWSLIQRGGVIYVCGDAKAMAPDVHKALHQIAVKHGDLNDEQAKATIKDLAQSGRYLRDVY